MPAKINLNTLPITEIEDHFYNGMSQRSLAIKYSVSEPTMKNIVRDLGLNRIGRISQKDIDSVLLNKGYHIAEISRITELDRATVSKILQMNDITPTKKNVKSSVPPEKVKSRYEQFKDECSFEQVSLLLSKSLYHACISTGYSEVILRRYAQEYNITFKKAFTTIRDVTADDIERIRNLYKENLYTNKEIEEMFSIGKATLKKITKDIEKEPDIVNKEFEEYKKVVRRLTTVMKNLYNINPAPRFHVDHKISVYDGFKLGIPCYLIASKENLEIIPSLDNLKKGSSSSITKDELYSLLKL